MNIGLIEIDGKMPKIPLMKISAYHKSRNDSVEWFSPLWSSCQKVYISKIFDFSQDIDYQINAEIIKGGTGYSLENKLPIEIESIKNIDYSIYPDCDYSMQLFSRGCIRACPFCVVNKKEGNIYAVDPMNLNPKGNHIEILDNNFFANPEWKEAINYLKKANQPVNFHGIDVRIINEEQCYALNSLRHLKQIHIAWDNPNDNLIPKITEMLKHIKAYKIMCYVLL
jgi:hypothetical protein